MTMKRIIVVLLVLSLVVFAVGLGVLTAADKYALKAPNGIAFSEVRGYETWPVIAPSYRTDKKEVRFIVGNEAMMNAYRQGIPGNGKPFPDGAVAVKIAYSERKNPDFQSALEPDVLQRIELIMKDSKRFADTSGWGYARFVYDAKTDTFTAYGKDEKFVQECYSCHTIVKGADYVFTKYFMR